MAVELGPDPNLPCIRTVYMGVRHLRSRSTRDGPLVKMPFSGFGSSAIGERGAVNDRPVHRVDVTTRPFQG
jgi:hypothetical protein